LARTPKMIENFLKIEKTKVVLTILQFFCFVTLFYIGEFCIFRSGNAIFCKLVLFLIISLTPLFLVISLPLKLLDSLPVVGKFLLNNSKASILVYIVYLFFCFYVFSCLITSVRRKLKRSVLPRKI